MPEKNFTVLQQLKPGELRVFFGRVSKQRINTHQLFKWNVVAGGLTKQAA